jgi:hypothetical protein
LEFPPPYNSSVDGFRFAEIGVEKLFDGDSVSWEVIAPDTSLVSGPIPITDIRVSIRSFDENTGNEISQEDTTSLQVERQAVVGIKLEITEPPSARDQRLTKLQEFTLQATVEKSGDADLSGIGSLELILNPEDSIEYIEVIPEDSSVTEPNSTVEWRLKTPDRFITSTIRARFVDRLLDRNTGLEAVLDPLNAVGSISISTEEKTIVATLVPEITPSDIIRGGDPDVPLIGLSISNEEAFDVDSVYIDSIEVTLIDNNGQPSDTDLFTIFNRIRVMNNSYYTENFNKISNVSILLADTVFSNNVGTQTTIKFNRSPLILQPGQIDTLVIMGDFNNIESSTSFSFKVMDIFAYVGDAGSAVTVVDDFGTKFSESDQGTSEIISILSERPEDQFFNYPNPFGENGEITRFVFYLEQPGTIEIKIYTLMGGLVRTLREDITEGDRVIDGIGQLTWDGYNDVGNRVLNGVYIAILKANGQTYKTKVAYIK